MIAKVREDGRVRRRDARREEILDAAMARVVAEGIAGFTIHRLAADLSYAPGALYRYFASKDALLAELQRRALAKLGAALAAARERAVARAAADELAPPQASLLPLLTAAKVYERLSTDSPETFRLLGMLLGDPRELLEGDEARAVIESATPLLTSVAELFAAAEQAGALTPGDARDRALVYWAALQGVMQIQKLGRVEPDALNAFRLAPILCRTLLLGFGADPAQLAEAERALRST